jgi:hypothetical protein
VGNDGLADSHHAEDVRLEDLPARRLWRGLECREQPDPGVVDQDVDGAEGLDSVADRRRDRSTVRDIELEDAETIRFRQAPRLPLGRGAHRRDDVPAAFEKVVGRGTAITRRASSDECCFHDNRNTARTRDEP